MKSILKIFKIVLVFFLSLVIIAFAWYAIEMATLGKEETTVPFVDFVLYLLGFGDLDSKDHYLQTAFSTLGLFAVTLLSSVFTVSLFDLRGKVKISPKIAIKSDREAKIILKTEGKDVYSVVATLISKCGQDVTTQEQLFPFIAKKSQQAVSFELEPGTPIYKYLRAVYLETDDDPQLILTVTYTDIESGQEYSMAQKYQYSADKKSDIIFSGDESCDCAPCLEKTVEEKIRKNIFDINLASVWACEAEDIDISYGCQDATRNYSQKQAFCANVHMTGNKVYEPRTFTMAVTGDLLGNDWRTYYDLGCVLKFDYEVIGNIAVTMELKYGVDNVIKYEKLLRPQICSKTYALPLRDLDYAGLKNVRELCFTVFYKDVNPEDPTGSFLIKNCALEVS